WDETHFGKMGSWYIKREFFFDVHPPLGKMLIGLFGVMTGYDGQFPFDKPGDEYGDTNYVGMRMTDVIKHFVARAVCLILIPIVVYMIIFAVHFKVLNHSGNGDGFYSSAFQSQLIGNKLYNVSMPENIAFGSIITLKQRRTGGAYLHSHWHLYPEDHPPRQQQITTYAHKDYNNYWKIKMADREAEENETAQLIVSGDLVRLEHVVTRRNLHSHAEQAPLSKKHYQVSGYGTNGTGDANDVWIVEVVGYPLGTPIQTARSKLKFIHYHVRCALYSHDKKLPKWGWEQMEATCNPNLREPKAVWSVEEISDERLPNASFELYSPSFAEKIMESHAVMTQGNSGLKPKEGEITSRPWQWPINFRGQIFSGKDHRIYLLGNPIIFWGCLVAMAIFLLLYLIHSVKVKRKIKENELWRAYKEKVFGACWWLFLGWALHYLPFWPMTRVLYFHHYFPAFLYSAMLTGITIDFSVTAVGRILPESWTMVVFHTIIGSVLGILALSFYLFYPLTYGMSGPMAQQEGSMMYGLKWMDSWDI
ncbi:hypothetical protein FSP39_002461, partial [Pinctada imbricata]